MLEEVENFIFGLIRNKIASRNQGINAHFGEIQNNLGIPEEWRIRVSVYHVILFNFLTLVLFYLILSKIKLCRWIFIAFYLFNLLWGFIVTTVAIVGGLYFSDEIRWIPQIK